MLDIFIVFCFNHQNILYYLYKLILHKDANIDDIKIQYLGAENLNLDNGKLVIKTAHQTLVEKIPLSFINDDRTQEVEVNYNLDDKGILSFKTKN